MKKIILPFFIIFLFLGCATTASKEDLKLIHYSKQDNSLSKIKKLFQEKKIHVNAVDKKGYFPLYVASINGNSDIVKFLLQHGANANQKIEQGNNQGFTALLGVCWNPKWLYEKYVLKVVKNLVNYGADINYTDSNNKYTALSLALHQFEFKVAKYLINKGAKVREQDLKYLLDMFETKNNKYIMFPRIGGHPDKNFYNKVKSLIILTIKNKNILINNKEKLFIKVVNLGDKDIVKTFIKNGAPLNATNNERRTPLIIAAIKGYNDIVKELILAGANPYIKDEYGKNAIYYIKNYYLKQLALNPNKYKKIINNPYLYFPALSKYIHKDKTIKKIINAVRYRNINQLKKLNYKKYKKEIMSDILFKFSKTNTNSKDIKFLVNFIILSDYKNIPNYAQKIILSKDKKCLYLKDFLDHKIVLNKEYIPTKCLYSKNINLEEFKKMLKIGLKPNFNILQNFIDNEIKNYTELLEKENSDKIFYTNFRSTPKLKKYKHIIFKKLDLITPYLNKKHFEYNSYDILYYSLLNSISDYKPVEKLKFEMIKYLLDNDVIDPFFYYVVWENFSHSDYNSIALIDDVYDYAKRLPNRDYNIYDKYSNLVFKFRKESPISFFAKNNNLAMLKFIFNHKEECKDPVGNKVVKNFVKYFLYCKIYIQNNDLDINERDLAENPALYYAIKNNNIKMVKLLLKYGANPNEFDSLSLAFKTKNLPMIKLLLSYKANINKSNILKLAFQNKNKKLINYLLKIHNLKFKQSDLNNAVKYGSLKDIKILLKKGLKTNEKTFEYALERGNKKIINYLYTHSKIPVNTKILEIIVNKNMFPLYKNIIKNKPISCDQIEEVAKLNNKKYINLMKKYKSKKIKKCIKGLEYYLQDYTNPNFDWISRNNIKALKILYRRYYNTNIPQKIAKVYKEYYKKHLKYMSELTNKAKSINIKNCYNGADEARCCFIYANNEKRGILCYKWNSNYNHYDIFPVAFSGIAENGYYESNYHRVWSADCGYSNFNSVYGISDALYKIANCAINGHY